MLNARRPQFWVGWFAIALVLALGPALVDCSAASSAPCSGTLRSALCSVSGTATVSPGSLAIEGPTSVKWASGPSGVTANVSAPLTLTAIDATGSGAGWTISAAISQVTDQTGTGVCQAAKPCRLPTSKLTLNGSSTTANSNARPVGACRTGSTCRPPINSVTYPVTLTGQAQSGPSVPSIVANAGRTSGMGAVTLATDLWLAMPANAFSGTYSDTITLTISSGPEVAAPTVAAVSPDEGPATKRTKVTITGSNFTTVTAVTVGGIPAVVTRVTGPTRLTATVPANRPGSDAVVVTALGGASTVDGSFTYLAVPTVTGVSPTAGKLAGGTVVTVTGTGFATGATVAFGIGHPGTTVDVLTTAKITVKAPPHAAGTVTLTVTTPGGTSEGKHYSYDPVPTITSLSRANGPVAGGTQVTVTGSGFTGATSVSFGTTPAKAFTYVSTTQLVATSPVHAAGTVRISVTTLGGTTPTTGADLYQYVYPAPAVSAVSPASGPAGGGTTVTVVGSGFTGATTVFFGSAKGTTVSVTGAGTLTVKSPPGTSGTSLNVQVKTPGGESPAVAADLFTYVPGPTITSLSRTTGPVTGGTKVTISGTGFTTVKNVKFGTATARTFTVKSTTQIVATSPAHAAGQVRISVTTASGTTPATGYDLFTF